jgi:hypothetical protein
VNEVYFGQCNTDEIWTGDFYTILHAETQARSVNTIPVVSLKQPRAIQLA